MSRLLVAITLVLVHAQSQTTKPGPANVVIVANANSALSQSVTEYYAMKRGIPRANVCHIKTTNAESISRARYEAEIEAPIARFLIASKLVESTLYLVTTSEVPLKIEGRGDGMNNDGASVDSELTLLYQTLRGRKHQLDGPLENPYFRASTHLAHPQFPLYLVARLAAYDFHDVKGMIDHALIAKNTGNIAIDLKGDSDDEGNGWLRDAMIALPTSRTIFDDGRKILSGLPNIIAYGSWGSNDTYRKQRYTQFQWLPGAIATEFVSTNARTFIRPPDSWNLGTWKDQTSYYAGAPQSLSADYIHEGATGVSGHVNEPFLSFCPRPQYVLPAYIKGENLVESFYRGIPAVSWQNVVLGDPLCSLGPSQ